MQFIDTFIPDLKLLKPKLFRDDRGFFMETRHKQKFNDAGITQEFVQDNHSRSKQGVLRGLHYQIKQPQGKLIRVIAGEVFDVAVDLRVNSPTFGKWFGQVLSATNKLQMWVPQGFAHGFYVLSVYAEFIYSCTALYAPAYERCIRWDDPMIAIQWPLINEEQPVISAKDRNGFDFSFAEYFRI